MMKKSIISNLLFFFLFAIPTLLFSQNNTGGSFVVTGFVKDSLTDETIAYATARIYDEAKPDVVYKAIAADENGKMLFNITKKGDYFISVEYLGKVKNNRKFSIGDSKTVDLGNILMKDNSELLSEIVVTAQKPLVKVDIDKITYSIEDDPESSTSNALDMLKKVPMVTVDGEDNIQLKGSSGYKIFVNGKPSSMIASNPKDVLKSMPASSIKNIEVITDPGAKYDAEGLAGIINIITQKNSSMGGYNARVTSRVDTRGGYGMGGFLTLKSGKLGFTGNYNYYDFKSPRSDANSFTRNVENSDYKYLYQNGNSKNNGNGQYGSGEISYEIDPLNLINVGFNRYYGKYYQDQYQNVFYQSTAYQTTREYEQWTKGKYTYGATSINADYQRSSSKVKDRMLTVSYLLNLSPRDWKSNNRKLGIIDSQDLLNNQYSDGRTNEHTFQLDYTTPFAKIHTLEAGAKYILRLNKSNSGSEYWNDTLSYWKPEPSDLDKFKHDQNIFSGYLGYNVKLKKVGFKTGVRYEYTDLKVKYNINSDQNFNNNYSNFIPSATISYQLTDAQNFRLGYNMRILRPNIEELNPYLNTSDSTYISSGNPELDAVKSHTISLNYSYYNPKLNVNTNLSYDFTNNDIEQITTYNDGIRRSTYGNIGKKRNLGLNVYVNWTPITKLKITSNLTGSYVNLKSNNEDNLKNDGFGGNIYMNVAYTLPQQFRVNVYGGGGTPSFTLQTKGGAYNFYGLSLSKDFLKDKLSVSVSASNIFEKNSTYKNKYTSPTMYMETENNYKRSRVNFTIAFKFGEMKEQIKKAQRTISNDDSISSGSGSNSSSGMGQGG